MRSSLSKAACLRCRHCEQDCREDSGAMRRRLPSPSQSAPHEIASKHQEESKAIQPKTSSLNTRRWSCQALNPPNGAQLSGRRDMFVSTRGSIRTGVLRVQGATMGAQNSQMQTEHTTRPLPCIPTPTPLRFPASADAVRCSTVVLSRREYPKHVPKPWDLCLPSHECGLC